MNTIEMLLVLPKGKREQLIKLAGNIARFTCGAVTRAEAIDYLVASTRAVNEKYLSTVSNRY